MAHLGALNFPFMASSRSLLRAGLLVLVLSILGGCATRQQPDPLEGWNRKVFSFNETVDTHVMQPVARGYRHVTPQPVRTGVANFFGNLKDIWSTINLFLQGRLKDGAMGVIRVSINTTLGLGGLIDLATPMQIEKPNEDLGQTLGSWGVPSGAYVVWPILGPSTFRDSIDIPVDAYSSGALITSDHATQWGMTGLRVIDLRARLLDATNLLDDVALDKYAFVRSAYLQRRLSLVHNGNVPPDDDVNSEDDGGGYAPYEPEPEPAPEPQPESGTAPAPAPASAPAAPAEPAASAAAPVAQPEVPATATVTPAVPATPATASAPSSAP
ncbi:MAG: VacJ family lipoprotein [Aquabacterium sp.]